MSFCRIDGAKKITEWTGEFNELDGQREVREICPLKPCEHSVHDTETLGYNWFLGSKQRCKRCGRRWYYDG